MFQGIRGLSDRAFLYRSQSHEILVRYRAFYPRDLRTHILRLFRPKDHTI